FGRLHGGPLGDLGREGCRVLLFLGELPAVDLGGPLARDDAARRQDAGAAAAAFVVGDDRVDGPVGGDVPPLVRGLAAGGRGAAVQHLCGGVGGVVRWRKARW